MTQEEIVRMAREAGFINLALEPKITRFAALVAAHAKQEYIDSVYEQHRETMFSNKDLGMLVDAVKAEREACAKVCAEGWKEGVGAKHQGDVFAVAIRARGENGTA